ncbi:MAG TPA: hypothetical protein VFX22_10965, partial [Candidatus Kapabacteria bacterium]|nr:hypothetical protein [Candidatus Kapabacteria bacterium]
MLPKRLLTIILTTVLAVMGTRAARAQWVQTNGPWGGDAFCLASTGPHLLAGTNNGLYISTNNGDSWNLDTVGIPRGGVTAMLAQDTDVIIGVAGTGAIRSTDGGSQWIVLDSGLTDSTIVSFNRIGDHLYAGTEKGIFRLNNGENDWQALSDELPPLPVSAIIGIDSTMFIGMQGVHLSTDSGLTWRGDGLTNDEVTSLAAIGQTIFAATPSSGIFRSNQSSSWTRIDSGLERPFNITALLAFGDTLFAGSSSGNLYRSIDSGTSWDRVDAGFFPSGINTLFATAHFLYAGTATNGIFRSADQSRSWNSASGGLG